MRRGPVILLVSVVVVAAAAGAAYLAVQGSNGGAAGGPGPGSTPTIIRTRTAHNPFGIFLNPRLFDLPQRIQIARDLGVRYIRSYPVLVPAWTGQCSECQPVHDAGLEFVLTVRNSPSITQPASPPTDLDAYRTALAGILDAYRPALLVVENEEDTTTYWTGTPEQYDAELEAACEVSHSKGIPCTNGGLVSVGASWLVYQHLLDTDPTEAQDFADHGLQSFQRAHLQDPGYVRSIADAEMALVKSYRDTGIDYMNIHWYMPDPVGFHDAVTVMKELSGLPVISNEMGQHDTDPDAVVQMLDEVIELKVPYAVWFSSDGRLSKALVDPDGSLRPNGEAFRQVMESVVGKS
jgi:hypothetical protein